jgi:hypothetical protein
VNRAVDGDLVAIEVLGDETEAERRAEREIIRLEGRDCGHRLYNLIYTLINIPIMSPIHDSSFLSIN